jgi:predicted aldo/keto reductase-like oxidoreductase
LALTAFWQDEGYAGDFRELVSVCRERSIAIQTIKSIARGYWGDKNRTHVTWYEPLVNEEAIRFSVRWVLGLPDVFLISTGALQEVSKVLRAAATFETPPSDAEMKRVVQKQGITPLF